MTAPFVSVTLLSFTSAMAAAHTQKQVTANKNFFFILPEYLISYYCL